MDEASPTPETVDSTPAKTVRTRFAPSPTGFPHIGVLRTALFSYLMARRHHGQFILRIEDTDQARLVPGALERLIESLHVLGMHYDEGPDLPSVSRLDAGQYGTVRPEFLPERGGDFGPYFQSQRLNRYHEIVQGLLENGHAYYAFETKEELDAQRARADAFKRPFLFRGPLRDAPLDEMRVRAESGEPHVVRFKMPLTGSITTRDALRGVTEYDAATQDDFVILKADGFPPYHLAAVVDDHDMRISHVFRGTEWLSSAPKHFALYHALGWEPPIFVHVASVNGDDGKKLSKRTGAKPVVGTLLDPKTGEEISSYLDDGFLPDALFNFLALVGWSPGDDTELMPRDEIIRRFDLDGLSVSPAIFDLKKLTWMNGVYIRQLPPEMLTELALPFLANAGLVSREPNPNERRYIQHILLLDQERLKRLDEAPELTDFFFADLPEYAEESVQKWLRRDAEDTAVFLDTLRAALAKQPDWSVEEIETTCRQVGEANQREKGKLTHPLRVALTGREVGPGLFELMAVLGRERVQQRLEHAAALARE